MVLGTSASTALAGDTTTISGSQATAITNNTAKVSMVLGTTAGTALEGDTTTITPAQATAITNNTTKISNVQSDWNATSGLAVILNKPSIPSAAPVDSVNGEIGTVVLDTSDIAENTNLYYTEARVSANSSVTLNTAKVGFTQALVSANTDVTNNTAKVGITSAQATDITNNNAKVSMVIGTAANEAMAGNTTVITSAQATAITDNSAKNSYPSVDATKLAGIEDNAEVNVQSDWNATSGDALILNKPTIPSAAPVDSVNGLTGVVTLTTSNISEGTNKYMVLGTTASTALAGNTALLQLGTTSTTALAGDTNLLQLGLTSTTALAGDTTTISAQQATDITNNNNKVGITTSERLAIVDNSTKLAGIETGAEVNTIDSITSGEPSGSDQVINVVSLSQTEYDGGTKVATTFYIIT